MTHFSPIKKTTSPLLSKEPHYVVHELITKMIGYFSSKYKQQVVYYQHRR